MLQVRHGYKLLIWSAWAYVYACACRWERETEFSDEIWMKNPPSASTVEQMQSDHLQKKHCRHFPMKIRVNILIHPALHICTVCTMRRVTDWYSVREMCGSWRRKRKGKERAGDSVSRRKERCGSIWEMSVTLMNYLRLGIPRPPRDPSIALW